MSTFEIVRGPEGDCLLLDDTRISGPKPWGGGTITKTFHTDKAYAAVPQDELDRLKAENTRLREELESVGTAAYLYGRDGLKAENEKLKAENAELVRVLHELEQEAVHAYRCLQHDCDQVLESEQHFFKKWWSSDCENAKLRKLVPKMARALGVGTDWCYSTCSHEFMCDPFKECPIVKDMRELGIEVEQ